MTVRSRGSGGQRGRAGGSASRSDSHFSLRTGLIALYAAFVAVIAGVLSYLSHPSLASSVVAGVIALAGAFVFFDKIIGD